jgi:hypothetical protein
MLSIVDATYLGGYRLRVRFSDGMEGEVSLQDELWGAVFEPLLDPVAFADFSVSAELGTIVWKNGADFAPEFLRGLVVVS